MTGLAVFIIVIMLAAVTLIFPVACVVKGAVKKRRAIRPVEYYPPRGYSPIDVMLNRYGKRCVPRELFNPLMLYWAQMGYITIEEDCKRGLKLTKLKNMPTESDSPTHKIQLDLFNCMFASSDVFCTLAATSADEIYLKRFVNKVTRCAASETTAQSKRLAKISIVIAAVCLIVSAALFIAYIGAPAAVGVFSVIGLFAFWSYLRFGKNSGANKWGSEAKRMDIMLLLFFCAWGGIPFIFLLVAGVQVGVDMAVGIVSIFASGVANIYFLSDRIDIRSDESLEVYGRIDAFKTFLVEVESDKLETLVEEDPDYFYDILPFCYILHITEKLKPKFDRIALDGPSWYLGDLRETLMF